MPRPINTISLKMEGERETKHAPRLTYHVGLTLAQWQPILKTAREAGAKHAAEWHGVPLPAVNAMLEGREEMVA